MATTYAGCTHGEYLDSCMEALAVYGVGGRHRILAHVDNGGTGKSAMGPSRLLYLEAAPGRPQLPPSRPQRSLGSKAPRPSDAL